MSYDPQNPLIVQGDHTVLLEVDNQLHEEARDQLARFAELEKSPEHIHTYRITPLSLWNAAAAGERADDILSALVRYSKYDLPGNVAADIRDYMSRYGRLKLVREGGALLLVSEDTILITQLLHNKRVAPYIVRLRDAHSVVVRAEMRGHLKQALVQFGYPAEDLAGYVDGAPVAFSLRPETLSGRPFGLRDYQQEAVEIFWAQGQRQGGSGVIVLPCGAGKTLVGAGVMAKAQCHTLVLCFGTVAVHQWMNELLDKTDLSPDLIGEYTGDVKDIRPITVTTYQVLTYRPGRRGGHPKSDGEIHLQDFPHLSLFTSRDWGLLVYDEVHLLPAPVFRMTAEIQARRRLGLTATLVREDGRESDVFSLIGPKKYDVPWKALEKQGWIATADCWEIRVALSGEERMDYALAEDPRIAYRLAAINRAKLEVLFRLVSMHREDNVLVIGQYIEQLETIAAALRAPLITGKTPIAERERQYAAFRRGELKLLVVSKVANFALDLPEANVAIQVSGTFGSRQEEAQRLGRILRPKAECTLAHFYSIVTRETLDQDYAAKRQMFLAEQGYRYTIMDATELLKHDRRPEER